MVHRAPMQDAVRVPDAADKPSKASIVPAACLVTLVRDTELNMSPLKVALPSSISFWSRRAAAQKDLAAFGTARRRGKSIMNVSPYISCIRASAMRSGRRAEQDRVSRRRQSAYGTYAMTWSST